MASNGLVFHRVHAGRAGQMSFAGYLRNAKAGFCAVGRVPHLERGFGFAPAAPRCFFRRKSMGNLIVKLRASQLLATVEIRRRVAGGFHELADNICQ